MTGPNTSKVAALDKLLRYGGSSTVCKHDSDDEMRNNSQTIIQSRILETQGPLHEVS